MRFKRACNRCGKIFRPTGATQKLCEDCRYKANRKRMKLSLKN